MRPFFVRSGHLFAAIWSGLAVSVLFVPAIVFFVRRLYPDVGSRRLLAAVIGLGLLIAVVGYHYDRYWLPIVIPLALCAAVALDWLLRPGTRVTLRRLAAITAMALIAWRGLSLDALMLLDSRNDARRWLLTHVGPNAPLAFVGRLGYLPRFDGLDARELDPSIESTLTTLPPVVVVNVEYMKRYKPGSDEERWWQWFSSDRSPYRVVYRVKQRPFWSAMSYERRLYTGVEDRYSNIEKVNPDIAVFSLEARAPPGPAPTGPPPRRAP